VFLFVLPKFLSIVRYERVASSSTPCWMDKLNKMILYLKRSGKVSSGQSSPRWHSWRLLPVTHPPLDTLLKPPSLRHLTHPILNLRILPPPQRTSSAACRHPLCFLPIPNNQHSIPQSRFARFILNYKSFCSRTQIKKPVNIL
jgi:hypothetical protein